MKLVSISFKAIPRMPGVRPNDLVSLVCDKPNDALRDWRVAIRGQQVFFISPAGWDTDRSVRRQLDGAGPVTVFELPRAEVFFQWQGTADELEALFKGGKYESPPFGWQPPTVVADKPIIEQIPLSQMGDA